VEAPEYTRIELKETNPTQANGFRAFALSLVLPRSLGEERVLSPPQFFRGHVFLMRRHAPLLAERIGKLGVTVSPEHILHGHVDAGPFSTARLKMASTLATYT
jgi:hypothetical protein